MNPLPKAFVLLVSYATPEGIAFGDISLHLELT